MGPLGIPYEILIQSRRCPNSQCVMRKTLPFALLLVLINTAFGQESAQPLTDREKLLLDEIRKLDQRVAALEALLAPRQPNPP